MDQRDVSISSGDITLAATLATPGGDDPPAALLIAGSGPLDRDGNYDKLPLSVSRDLAGVLDDAGWASLRFDKRGVGNSGGDYLSAGMGDELSDVTAAYRWLVGQPAIGPVVAIGHSVGALFAAELAAWEQDLAGAVLLAYTLKTGEETLRWQADEIAKTVPGWAKSLLKVFRTSINKQQSKAITKIGSSTEDVVRIQGQKINAKWMREFIAYDPEPVLRATKVPLLAIIGEKDVQVDPSDLGAVANVAGSRADTFVVEDVDHILRYEPAAISNPKKYKSQLENPIDPRVVTAITSWLEALLTDEKDAPAG